MQEGPVGGHLGGHGEARPEQPPGLRRPLTPPLPTRHLRPGPGEEQGSDGGWGAGQETRCRVRELLLQPLKAPRPGLSAALAPPYAQVPHTPGHKLAPPQGPPRTRSSGGDPRWGPATLASQDFPGLVPGNPSVSGRP